MQRTVSDRWNPPGVLNVNARSLYSEESDELLQVVTERNQVSIVYITETWFKDYMPDDSDQLLGFNCERNDRLGRASRVTCFIDKKSVL